MAKQDKASAGERNGECKPLVASEVAADQQGAAPTQQAAQSGINGGTAPAVVPMGAVNAYSGAITNAIDMVN